jgi:hypothetical protein
MTPGAMLVDVLLTQLTELALPVTVQQTVHTELRNDRQKWLDL